MERLTYVHVYVTTLSLCLSVCLFVGILSSFSWHRTAGKLQRFADERELLNDEHCYDGQGNALLSSRVKIHIATFLSLSLTLARPYARVDRGCWILWPAYRRIVWLAWLAWLPGRDGRPFRVLSPLQSRSSQILLRRLSRQRPTYFPNPSSRFQPARSNRHTSDASARARACSEVECRSRNYPTGGRHGNLDRRRKKR